MGAPASIRLVAISGSHGEMLVDRMSGHIVERIYACDCDQCDGVGYSDVLWVDPAMIAPDDTRLDVLSVGLVDASGYVQPMVQRYSFERADRHTQPQWFFDWAELALLPPPTHTNASDCLTGSTI